MMPGYIGRHLQESQSKAVVLGDLGQGIGADDRVRLHENALFGR